MHVAILQCDTVAEEFVQEFGQYSQMVKQLINLTQANNTFNVYDCQAGELPDPDAQYDLYITTGSKAGVYDDEPWITDLIEYVAQLHQNKRCLVGICFGHQVIATALKGNVEKSQKGWGVGVSVNQLIQHEPWMSPDLNELNLIVSHQDQVTRLPENAKVIASSNFCPYFMVQWSDHAFSVQGHPEWQPSYSHKLMEKRRGIIPDETITNGIISLSINPDNAVFSQWIHQFVKGQ